MLWTVWACSRLASQAGTPPPAVRGPACSRTRLAPQVVSKVVAEAPAAQLFRGTGDVSPTGAAAGLGPALAAPAACRYLPRPPAVCSRLLPVPGLRCRTVCAAQRACPRASSHPTAGPCKEDIARHCRKVRPGAGRLAACLGAQARGAADDPAAGGPPLRRSCQAELDDFHEDASTNINKNVAVGEPG